MFQFYLDNYLNKNKLDMLNKKFKTNFQRSALNGLFNKHGYKKLKNNYIVIVNDKPIRLSLDFNNYWIYISL